MLTACYTTAGAGQDLQAAGNKLERSADRNTTTVRNLNDFPEEEPWTRIA